MIIALKSLGLVRSVAFSLLLAAPMYAYKHYLPWEYKPMSEEDEEHFSERWMPTEVFKSEWPDMGAESVEACQSPWGTIEVNHFLRVDDNWHLSDKFQDGRVAMCRRIAPGLSGWSWEDVEP
jgi:hypothetical protein